MNQRYSFLSKGTNVRSGAKLSRRCTGVRASSYYTRQEEDTLSREQQHSDTESARVLASSVEKAALPGEDARRQAKREPENVSRSAGGLHTYISHGLTPSPGLPPVSSSVFVVPLLERELRLVKVNGLSRLATVTRSLSSGPRRRGNVSMSSSLCPVTSTSVRGNQPP